ncbi:hypothetical protein HMPREF5175_01719 [Lactobacillus gasseri SV-16A-US]|uniref:Uncharacterized protein n=4 Tax=Lactobacillus gasseri TaxID=1596 RepID=A0A833CD68_LACGS|nr:hypothetical protein LGAS_1718 [Lactobacillus gasseri ATCC 33323 = JCM 1131]EJN53873.1 Hypothetical protein A131_138807 [Lactobacillus gasseri CECT 5714]KAB1950350.1 hypothetical protein F8244_08435 [Lactobacillus gasseri]KFL94742.1 hypothetical protein HMPREF0516_01528 [Lactobacillus gasseri SJ-9E-US]KFL96502.1 hypothetical protein HMPREF5175_01719 [Lactobacillus gasseri SV-16A-US]
MLKYYFYIPFLFQSATKKPNAMHQTLYPIKSILNKEYLLLEIKKITFGYHTKSMVNYTYIYNYYQQIQLIIFITPT